MQLAKRLSHIVAATAMLLVLSAIVSAADTDTPMAATPELLAQVASDLNELFPDPTTTLVVEWDRDDFEQYHWKQIQRIRGRFEKTPTGDFEQVGSCESYYYTNKKLTHTVVEDTIQRLTIEKGKLITYAIYTDRNGQQKTYGPSLVVQVGGGIQFREISPNLADFTWESTSFYRKRDGTLGSSRYWKNVKYFEEWQVVDDAAAPAEKPEPLPPNIFDLR